MAIAARKTDDALRYAPATRVYSQAEANPAAEPPVRRPPQPSPVRPSRKPGSPATRVARQAKPSAFAGLGRLLLITMSVLTGAALLIMLLVRYAIISQEYAVVNELKDDIVQYQQEIEMLNVQLNGAVTLEEAREAALAAGMGYPTAEQIVRITGQDQAQAGGQTAPE